MHPMRADDNSLPPLNRLVIESIRQMPSGGGYSASTTANHALGQAVKSVEGKLSVTPALATPSYCSEATYLVFLQTLSKLQKEGSLALDAATLSALKKTGQPDGTGIWGRWNANGPGTAVLFRELKLGPNFTDLHKARPGDFLKIFWNDRIGSTEHGHSVIFLGYDPKSNSLTFWSSNIPGGYGTKTVSLRKIHHMLFSRLEHPENINHPLASQTDKYLSSLVHRSSSFSEMKNQCGLGSESRW